VWLSQTTLSVDETMDTVRALRERFPKLQNPPSRRHLLRHAEPPGRGEDDGARAATWCWSSGRTNSSNSVRLVEVALQAPGPVPRT
jgi:4-hydroxy-3-methylbut-2-enyl diphosphate reductase